VFDPARRTWEFVGSIVIVASLCVPPAIETSTCRPSALAPASAPAAPNVSAAAATPSEKRPMADPFTSTNSS
jgi:hypothetical protein